ncbi:MAG: hypothetical protein FWB74_07790 [Defluviitaleaceae bacterium]|nr:hypothetical protein [Defluviitaleaceae bacterium]
MWGLLVPIALVLTLALGFVVGLQWMPKKNGEPPAKPIPKGLDILIAALLFGGVASIVIWILLNRSVF